MDSQLLADALVEDNPEVAQGVLRNLREDWKAERREVEDVSARAEQANRQDHRSVEGLGRLRCRIPATAYHYWGQRLGYKCWKDAAFLREFERDNPEIVVKSGGTKIQISTGGISDSATRKKFSKKY